MTGNYLPVIKEHNMRKIFYHYNNIKKDFLEKKNKKSKKTFHQQKFNQK
jgi:hypothetical protein